MDLTHSIKYLGNILALKICLRENPTEYVRKEMLADCKISFSQIENYYRINVIYKDKVKVAFFVTNSDKTLNVPSSDEEWEYWEYIIRIGKTSGTLYEDPNTFSIKSICFDIVYSSSSFIPFKPILAGNLHDTLSDISKNFSIAKLHKSDLAYKICFGVVPDFKFIKFLVSNMDVGNEINYRKVIG